MKTTGWIDGDLMPVRVGMYQKRYSHGETRWSFWNGKFWGWLERDKQDAERFGCHESVYQHLSWRGLTEKAQ